jgi:hypothetical protein
VPMRRKDPMKKLLSTITGRVLAGALVTVIAFGGGVAASNFGFIDDLARLIGLATDKAADVSADAVNSNSGDTTYENKIKNDVSNATNGAIGQLSTHAQQEINRGNGSIQSNYEQLKTAIEKTTNDGVIDGKTKITNKVNNKVTTVNESVNQAAQAQINAELAKYPAFTGK